MIDDTDNPAEKTADRPQAATSAKAPAARPRRSNVAKVSASSSARKRRAPAAKPKPATVAKRVKRAAPAKESTTGTRAISKAVPLGSKKTSAAKPAKVKKAKLVRDSFTMPKVEYSVIATLKERCLKSGVSPKKSEILRAAIANLAKLTDRSLVGVIKELEVIKTGRPSKSSK